MEVSEILKQRLKRLQYIRSDRKILEAHWKVYSENYALFISDWFLTYDPRKTPAYLPFILFPKQVEMVKWIMNLFKNKQHGLIEKSRDMGASWLCMAIAICMWLFMPGAKVAFGSWKQEKIDKIGDPDSIFEKGRIALRNLPVDFMPAGFNIDKHATFLRITNPENGNTITGEAGDQIGRGGRSTIYFKDEAAFYQHPETVESALSQNTDVQMDVSTPNGNGNLFYQKRVGGKIPVFTLHWRDHPGKDEAWYQKQKATTSPVIIAQEIDIDYNASVSNICIPMKWIEAAIDLDLPETGPMVAGFDVADEGEDKNAVVIRKGPVIKHIEEWSDEDPVKATDRAFGICKGFEALQIYFDSIGVGAGAKGEFKRIDDPSYVPDVVGVCVAEKPTSGEVEEERKNVDMFVNLRAQLWWDLRKRFERTYHCVEDGREYDSDDLISIPDHRGLINELCQPLYLYRNGKILIEAKKDMKKRGIKSPNMAEALLMTYGQGKIAKVRGAGKAISGIRAMEF